MQFEIIVWKPHVPDQDLVACFRFSICIRNQEEVLTVYLEVFVRQLGPGFAPLLDREFGARSITYFGVGVKCDGEASIWELRYLFSKLQCVNSVHSVVFLIFICI